MARIVPLLTTCARKFYPFYFRVILNSILFTSLPHWEGAKLSISLYGSLDCRLVPVQSQELPAVILFQDNKLPQNLKLRYVLNPIRVNHFLNYHNTHGHI